MKLTIILASILFSGAVFAESLTGVVSDEHCGAKHSAATAKDKSCVETCVKGGAAPVIVSDGKVYKISDDTQGKVRNHLGEKVTVNGKVEGDTVTIDTVSTGS
jgi:hypothetical protein